MGAALNIKRARQLWRILTTAVPCDRASSVLPCPPTELGTLGILVILSSVVLKAVKSVIGYGTAWKRGRLPNELSMPLLVIDCPLRISSPIVQGVDEMVSQARGQAMADTAASPLLLIAPTNPLMIMLLAHQHCPFAPLGALHARNRFEILRPEAFTSGKTREWRCTARMGGPSSPGRRVRKGVEADVVIDVYVSDGHGEKASRADGEVAFRSTITVLQPSRKHALKSAAPQSAASEWDRDQPSTNLLSLRLTAQLARSWAKLCKDYNPIHHSRLAARYIFGMPGTIAHGNCVVLGAFAGPSYPGSDASLRTLADLVCGRTGPWFLDVAFRRPMPLPLNVEIEVQRADTVENQEHRATKSDRFNWRAYKETARKGGQEDERDHAAVVYVQGRLGPL
ncbi:unnamed protein product [Parajaminaea phylloscopi]